MASATTAPTWFAADALGGDGRRDGPDRQPGAPTHLSGP